MGFSLEELNVARQSLYNKVVNYFLTREGVEALYIQGSVASGSTDEFSDIDFRVVIHSELYDRYILERFSAPKHWGEWLYNEWSDSFWICVSHFKPFNKIDLKISYTLLDKPSMLEALGELLKVYQNQVIKLHDALPLKRNKQIDLNWIDTIFKLCQSIK